MGNTKSVRVYRKVVLMLNKINPEGTGEGPLYLRLTIERKRKYISLGKYVHPNLWEEKSSKVLKGAGNASKLNHFITQELNKIDRIILDLENSEKEITFEAILKEYKTTGRADFIEFCKTEIELRKGELSARTISDHHSILRKVEAYQKSIKFHAINFEWLTHFEHYLRNKLGNGDNTVAGNIKFIRTYYNRAFKKCLCKKTDIEWGVKFEDGDRVPLTKNELQKLYNLWESDLLEESLQNVLRYFLYPCYAGGLRFNDIRKLRWDKLEDNDSGTGIRMKVRTSKTGAFVYVPIKGKALNLLPGRGSDNSLVFKTYNNKITNRKLAEIFDIAGIKRKATFHYSRHTFATIALTLKIPKEVIMKLMGIRQERVINIYAKIVDDLVDQEMEKWEMI
jgi:integrase